MCVIMMSCASISPDDLRNERPKSIVDISDRFRQL
jgi:hypothetical protein